MTLDFDPAFAHGDRRVRGLPTRMKRDGDGRETAGLKQYGMLKEAHVDAD